MKPRVAILIVLFATGATAHAGPGPIVSAVAIDSSAPPTLYAATVDGLIKSTDSGASWIAIQSELPHGVETVAVDPQHPSTVYAVTSGKVFKSTFGGGSWREVSEGLSGKPVHALAMHPTTSSTLYAATDDGVFASIDGGEHWQAAQAGLLSTQVLAVAIDPNTPRIVYAGTSAGVFKSIDGAHSWRPVNTGLPQRAVWALALGRGMPDTVYAGTLGGVFKSTDGGINWTAACSTRATVLAIAIDPEAPATVYAATGSIGYRTGGGEVVKSSDAGRTWRTLKSSYQYSGFLSLALDPHAPDTLYAGSNGEGLFRGTDAGVHWASVSVELRAAPVIAPATEVPAPIERLGGAGRASSEQPLVSLAGQALSYAFALGRAETAAYQRARFVCSG